MTRMRKRSGDELDRMGDGGGWDLAGWNEVIGGWGDWGLRKG